MKHDRKEYCIPHQFTTTNIQAMLALTGHCFHEKEPPQFTMPRIYYKEEKIAGQAIDTEFISLALFDYVFNNTDSRIFNYSELSNSYLVNMPSGNNLTFKKIELRKDGIYYNSAKGKLYLPSAIIFYDEKDFNFPSEFYFIAKVGNEIELRKCKGGKDIEWFHIPELQEAVDDPGIISKIESS